MAPRGNENGPLPKCTIPGISIRIGASRGICQAERGRTHENVDRQIETRKYCTRSLRSHNVALRARHAQGRG
jgi:hypothetical protein